VDAEKAFELTARVPIGFERAHVRFRKNINPMKKVRGTDVDGSVVLWESSRRRQIGRK
jgi:hypothetical protein